MPKIIAIGCGIEGNHAISHLFNSGVAGVKTIAIDTDKSRLDNVQTDEKILIGNGYEEKGSLENRKKADEHSIWKLEQELKGVELLFVTSCMGSKICSEAIPVLTKIGRKQDALVIGLITIPSEKDAEIQKPTKEDIIELSNKADTVAFVDHDRVRELFPALPIDQVCSFTGKLIADMIGGIVDCLNPEIPSLIKLDFADLIALMKNGGIGTLVFNEVEGEREKDHRESRLAHDIMQRSLMDVEARTTRNCLLIITQGIDSGLFEVEQVAMVATYDFDIDANILWGSVERKDFYGKLRCMGIIASFRFV